MYGWVGIYDYPGIPFGGWKGGEVSVSRRLSVFNSPRDSLLFYNLGSRFILFGDLMSDYLDLNLNPRVGMIEKQSLSMNWRDEVKE